MTDTAADLGALFEPTVVAVVGVGSDPLSPGTRVFRNLHRTFGERRFAGRVHGVNRKAITVDGHPTVADLADLDEVPDLVVVATPSESVEGLVGQCAELGVRAVVVLSAGFSEAGEEGRAAQRRISDVARAHGMAIVGPNSMGLISLPAGLVATFTNAVEEPNPGGRVAVVGQSGGMAAIVYTILVSQGVGVDHLVALGNEATTTFGDVARWLLANDKVDTVVGFVESLAGWDALVEAAEVAAGSRKTIAICRAGRSAAGASAAASHVGAIAGDDAVLTDLCRAHGIIEIPSLDGLVDVAKARSSARPLRGDRVGVVTASGGAGTLLADLLTSSGFELPTLSEELQARIYEVIPWYGAAANPVDTTAYIQNRPEAFAEVVEILCGSGEVDAVQVFLGTLDPIAERLIESISAAARAHPDVPVVVVWGGGSRRFKAAMFAAGVPTYDDPGRAVTGMTGLRAQRPVGRRPSAAAAPSDGGLALPHADEPLLLNEHRVRDLLEAAGLPVVAGALVHAADEAVKQAADLGDQVVLKLVAGGAEHKSDIGGVLVGVRGEEAVREGTESLLALAGRHGLQAEGVLVEEQAPSGLELLVAVRRDAVVGPVVVVGLGGTLAEVVAEAATRAAPLSLDDARGAVAQLFDGRLVGHRRGLGAADVDRVADLMVRLGDLAVAEPRITELECNPVIVSGERLHICDGLATVAPDTTEGATP